MAGKTAVRQRTMQLISLLSALIAHLATSACGTVVKNPKSPNPAPVSLADLSELTSSILDEIAESLASPDASVPSRPSANDSVELTTAPFECEASAQSVEINFAGKQETNLGLNDTRGPIQLSLKDSQTHRHVWSPAKGRTAGCDMSGKISSTWPQMQGFALSYDFTLDDVATSESKQEAQPGASLQRAWQSSGTRSVVVTNISPTMSGEGADALPYLDIQLEMTSKVQRTNSRRTLTETDQKKPGSSSLVLRELQTSKPSIGQNVRQSDSKLGWSTLSKALVKADYIGSVAVDGAEPLRLQVSVTNLMYKPSFQQGCIPYKGNMDFLLTSAATGSVVDKWSVVFDGNPEVASPSAMSGNGLPVVFTPGFCLQ